MVVIWIKKYIHTNYKPIKLAAHRPSCQKRFYGAAVQSTWLSPPLNGMLREIHSETYRYMGSWESTAYGCDFCFFLPGLTLINKLLLSVNIAWISSFCNFFRSSRLMNVYPPPFISISQYTWAQSGYHCTCEYIKKLLSTLHNTWHCSLSTKSGCHTVLPFYGE